MLQRIQSVFLLVVVVVFILLLFSPLYMLITSTPPPATVTLMRSIPAFIVHLIPVVLSLFTIFQYKNRPLQIRFCFVGLFLSVLTLVLTVFIPDWFVQHQPAASVVFGWGIYLLILNPLAFFLAARFIRRDEELVRSADRLR
jgi:hypothetical protein